MVAKAKAVSSSAPRLVVAYKKTASLIPYARNARTHSEAQVAQIAGSIREFGFNNPVLLDEQDGIIAGHGRVLAAYKLELEEVPTIMLAGLSEVQKRAFMLADNKLALNAGWDMDMLTVEVEGLLGAGFDALLTGFSQPELDHILSGWSPSSEPDETEPSNEGLMALIKVRCPMLDEADVRAALSKAIAESGLKGVELV